MAKNFCPNCGNPIKKNAKFCPKCGFKLNKLAEKKTAQELANQTPTRKKPIRKRKKNKVLYGFLVALLLVFAVFYVWGSNHYSRNNQINWIVSSLKNPQTDLSSYVTADDPDMHVTASSLKPLQNYYVDNQTKANQLGTDIRNGAGTEKISLQKSGHYLLLFPKYTLRLKTYTPQVKTNHSDSQVTINGSTIGRLQGADGSYYKELKPIFPGKYHVKVNSHVAGRNLNADATVNVWSNKTVDLNIRTETFAVDSVPNGDVYINDRKVGSLDNNGQKTFKDYPITGNMVLYVKSKFKGQSIYSQKVTDLSSKLPGGSASDDALDDDDEDSNSEADVVQNDNDEYVVKPKWTGLISKDDLEDLLDNAFNNTNDDDFIGGADNQSYQQIRKMTKGWDKDDRIESYDMDVDVVSINPAGNYYSSVVFRVKYTFEHEDNEHKQVMEYTSAIIHEENGKQKIQTIGNGKIISDHTEDD